MDKDGRGTINTPGAATDAPESGDFSFPRGFLTAYDILELLGQGRGTRTYLVMRRGTKALCVAKCYESAAFGAVHESDILKRLRHPGLPAFIEEFRDDKVACVIREYVRGTTLNEALEASAFSADKATDICRQLCDILIYIHGQTPPIIHRDIKPWNIILKPDGTIALIDFDIARTIAPGADSDTVIIGTRTYAPPEQYGFAQTDARTDIYALGVLFCRMLTGDTEVKNANIPNRRLAQIVRRCTAFSPQDRYQTALAVKRALPKPKKSKRAVITAAIAVCLCALPVFFLYGRAPKTKSVVFTQPLIEKAVRAQLFMRENEEISPTDLDFVEEIYIFGEKVFNTKEEFDAYAVEAWKDEPRGNIASLADIGLLPNLETLCVNYQTLSDASGLAENNVMEYINLSQTNLTDATPLTKLKKLRQAILYGTKVADLTCLNACAQLEVLEAGETRVSTVEALPLKAPVKILSLKRLPLPTLYGIEALPRIETLLIGGSGIKDLTPLLSCPSLAYLYISQDMTEYAKALGNAPFEIITE